MHVKLKKFLCGFIDHCFKNLDYNVKEKHIIEKLFDIEIFERFDKSIFYIGKFKNYLLLNIKIYTIFLALNNFYV